MSEPPTPPPRRNLAARALAFLAAVALGWAVLYVAYRYLSSGWRV